MGAVVGVVQTDQGALVVAGEPGDLLPGGLVGHAEQGVGVAGRTEGSSRPLGSFGVADVDATGGWFSRVDGGRAPSGVIVDRQPVGVAGELTCSVIGEGDLPRSDHLVGRVVPVLGHLGGTRKRDAGLGPVGRVVVVILPAVHAPAHLGHGSLDEAVLVVVGVADLLTVVGCDGLAQPGVLTVVLVGVVEVGQFGATAPAGDAVQPASVIVDLLLLHPVGVHGAGALVVLVVGERGLLVVPVGERGEQVHTVVGVADRAGRVGDLGEVADRIPAAVVVDPSGRVCDVSRLRVS